MSPKFSFIFPFFLSSMLLCCLATMQPDGLTMEFIKQIPKPAAACPFAGFHKQTNMISTNKAAKHMISPLTSYGDPFLFLAQVGIGSFQEKSNQTNFKTYYFQIDTGNELSWIQCEGCQNKANMCFPHKDPPYPNSQSKSYKPIPCNQNSCQPNQCKEGFCSYNVSYGSGSYTSGVLAKETFTFYSSHGKHTALKNITFGCSTDSKNMKAALVLLDKNPVSGVLGMGWGPRSFLAQLESISNGKFSYCIKANNTHNTYLRFGKHIVKSNNLQTTKIMEVKPSSAYHVNLLGISVNGVKLNISKTDLDLKKDGSGGCIIDSGTLATLLVKPIFDTLHTALADHMSRNINLKRWIIHNLHKDLCYEVLSDAGGSKNLPAVTFHLENADLEVEPEALFLFREFEGKNVFCLSMLSDVSKTIIGAYQQMKQKFVYDTKAKLLSFGPEDCEKNG